MIRFMPIGSVAVPVKCTNAFQSFKKGRLILENVFYLMIIRAPCSNGCGQWKRMGGDVEEALALLLETRDQSEEFFSLPSTLL